MKHIHLFERNVIRETRNGIRGFKCECGHWEPQIQRSDAERQSLTITPPAHETYRVLRLIGFGRRRA